MTESKIAWISSGDITGGSDPGTALPWWSFTKTVLAIAALRLVEDGRLELDGKRPGKPYTLRQLLQHQAGVPNYGGLEAYHRAIARRETPWSREELLERVSGDALVFEPGTGWQYSNVGYMFVREAIEEATDTTLGEALRMLVFEPIGLTDARLATTVDDFADVYWDELKGYDPGWVFHGCLIGAAPAAARLLHTLFSGALLRRPTLEQMLIRHDLGGPVPGRPWTRWGYSLGLMSGEMGPAGRAIGHSGGGPFGVNAVYHFPDLPTPTTVAAFVAGTSEGLAEREALLTALSLAG
ncbi:MAG: beta-lactamase family protein [Rhizobiales bacterium]|nr:beta-lactamase family protein [Hyphomicrobiales bacterium]